MYSVIRKTDGGWVGICVIQGGVERCEKHTRKAAIEWVIDCAGCMNHAAITEDDIKFRFQSLPKQDSKSKAIEVLSDTVDDLHIHNLELREVIQAFKIRVAYIGHPYEPHDWSEVLTWADRVLAKKEYNETR